MGRYSLTDVPLTFTYGGGPVDEEMLHSALEFLISLEPDEDDPTAVEQYDAAYESRIAEIEMARAAARQFGMQIEPRTLERMQEVFYEITNSSRYCECGVRQSVGRSTLNFAWDGIGEWQK